MIGWSYGLVLPMVGGSISRGRMRAAWATRVCTSCSARSMLRFRSNSTMTVARPCLLVEEIDLTPSMVVTASSSGSMTSDSMTSGEAPSSVTCTLMTGKSTSGFWLTPRRAKPIPPKTIRPAISIQAKTWLRIEMSESVTLRSPGSLGGARRGGGDHLDRRAVAQDVPPVGDHLGAGLESRGDLDAAVPGPEAQADAALDRL